MEDFVKALENAARVASNTGIIRFSRFLDPAQVIAAQNISRQYGVKLTTWGGYDHAERVIGCFHPYDVSVPSDSFPISCLKGRYPSKFCTITHRDLLGSFMSLGLTRACTGDMIISEEDVFLFACEETAPFIAQSLTSAGRASLTLRILDSIPVMPQPKGTTFGAIVSSLRLDAVLAAAYRLSRSAAAEEIRSGNVKVNHLPSERVDMLLQENALLSLKGHGRIRLTEINGLTKKQRISVSFFKYE